MPGSGLDWTYCDACSKRLFRTRKDARAAGKIEVDKTPGLTRLNVYQCDHFDGWHLTKRETTASIRQRHQEKDMATRTTEAIDLIRRCENVGWTVKKSGDGYIIITPTNGPYAMHLTYSDWRSLRNAEADLNRFGLATAEKNMTDYNERERTNKILKDRAANDKKLADAAAKLKATNSAANDKLLALARGTTGYLYPEEVGIEWFTADHPAMACKLVTINKKLAEQLLELNINNRPLRYTRTDRVGGIILSDQWRTTHQGIAIDREKNLQDGQHRLVGLIKACDVAPDSTIDIICFVGVDPDNFKAIDEGSLRTASDLLRRGNAAGSGTYATTIASIVRLAIAVDDGGENARRRPTNTDVVDWHMANDPDAVRAAASWAVSVYKTVNATPSALGAAHYKLSRVNGYDNPYLWFYFEGLATGIKTGTRTVLDDMDPRAAVTRQLLRDKQRNTRKNAIDQYRLLITGWNYVVRNRSNLNIQVRADTGMPTPLLCRPEQGSPPAALSHEYSIWAATQEDENNA